jgi:glycosyltransferase involved in cell wall biosynthesis
VFSSNHAVAKGVITGPDQVHVSYVHSPMRYAWDLQAQYLRQSGLERGLKGAYARWLLHRLRLWDQHSSAGVDVFVANSSYIADRIRKAYRRDAIVVPPPVAVERFAPAGGIAAGIPKVARLDAPYLVASRFAPYKRVELIAAAFARMPDRRLLVIGDGPGLPLVRAAAAGASNITLRAPVSSAELVELMQAARAFVFAAEEDFGITMVEAQACGTPVIAFGRGGSRDIVIDADHDRPTGVLFGAQSVEGIENAVRRFELAEGRITAAQCRENAMRFSTDLFRERMRSVVEAAMPRRAP